MFQNGTIHNDMGTAASKRENFLYYGDNLKVLRHYIDDESIDLIYLDPPFKSNQDYNVLFAERDGTQSAAQINAFEDTWQWDQVAAKTYQEVVESGGRVSQVMQAFRIFLGENDMLAYLSMMAPRIIQLRRVLKHSGSIYLHCDSTASHYLKLLMDAIFTPQCFRNEIIWKRTSAHNDPKKWGRVHDSLLFYTKTNEYTWNQIFLQYDPNYLETFLDSVDEKGFPYKRSDLTGAGRTSGNSGQPWRNIDVSKKGRHWAVPDLIIERLVGKERASELTTQEKLDLLDVNGRIHWPEKQGGMPRLRQYPEDLPGVPLQDVITDIRPLHNLATERIGYQTQKPEALLQRIIEVSSKEGNIVLDPFCGCGTAVAVAQRLNRRWIGIDITHLAINLIKHRLLDAFGQKINDSVYVIGEPTDFAGAAVLAAEDPYQFQWWALGLVGARPADPKKGADRGIDGRLYFHDEGPSGKTKQIVFSVKAGHVTSAHVRDLRGVLDRERAAIGVLIKREFPACKGGGES